MCTAMELARHVGKSDLVELLDLVETAGKTHTDAQFRQLIGQFGRLVPLERMHVCFAKIDPRTEAVVGFNRHILIDYPAEFVNEYVAKYARVDGAWDVLLGSRKPVIWHDIQRRFDSPEQQQLYGRAADFGLHDGFTFGARFVHSPTASIFAGVCDPKELTSHDRHVAVIEFMTPHLHLALSRIQFGLLKESPELTDREIEVINWAKFGKTDSEISLQLGVSPRTVKFHIENVIHKLQACNRVQATAIALAQGIIDWN